MEKPTPSIPVKDIKYGRDEYISTITDLEFEGGRNNTGEAETLLGSVVDSHKDNWMFRYINEQLRYLNKMVQYLDSQKQDKT